MEYKTCIKCGEHKELCRFSEKRDVCNTCRNASKGDYQRRWQEANRDKVSASSKAYYERNKDNPESAAKLWLAAHKNKMIAYLAQWHQENKKRRYEVLKEWRKNNPQIAYERAYRWREANKERCSATSLIWKRNNKGKVVSYTMAYKAKKLRATPSWATEQGILSFYTGSNALGMLTGEWHHVDHIVPLQSSLVCGLHCEANLQILPASENMSKGNRWWPDMWEPETNGALK